MQEINEDGSTGTCLCWMMSMHRHGEETQDLAALIDTH